MDADLPPGYTVRAATPEDAAPLAELFNAVTLDEVGVAWTDEADMRATLTAPSFDPARDAPLVFDEPTGLVAGLLLHPDGQPVTSVFALGLVRPSATGRGLGTFITLLAEDHARRLFPAESGRFTLRATRFVQNEAAAELFRDLGYQRVRTWWRMAIELGRDGVAMSLPAGLEIAPFEPDRDTRAVYDALHEAFRDHWGEGMGGYEDWVNRVVDGSASRFVLVAREGAEIAGVVVGRAGLAADPEAGSVEELGVRRRWRGRGLGLALLQLAFDEFRRRGLVRAMLTVDSENPTGATRLYERAGMTVELAWEHWEKELRPA
jgi:ribosomal protein S18 acetylase RimI-like enzyme